MGRPTTSARYLAFISYKHDNAPDFVRRLELALKQYGKPLLRRPFRIFRDELHLVPGTELTELIHNALDNSEFLILLASPGAARSLRFGRSLSRQTAVESQSLGDGARSAFGM